MIFFLIRVGFEYPYHIPLVKVFKRVNCSILFNKNENCFSNFEVYLDNFQRLKSSGTRHTCDVKL